MLRCGDGGDYHGDGCGYNVMMPVIAVVMLMMKTMLIPMTMKFVGKMYR